MSRQIINTGTIVNDGSGDSLRIAGQKINDTFEEIYNKIGDGADISLDLDFSTPPQDGQVLQYNAVTGRFAPGEAGARGFTGPQGPQGEQGIQGIQGEPGQGNLDGPDGVTDLSVPVFDGFTGRELKETPVKITDDGAIIAPQAGSVIPFFFDSQATFPDASANRGAIALADDTGTLYFSHSNLWLPLAQKNDVVTRIFAGPGISVNASLGEITITNTGGGGGGGGDGSTINTFEVLADAITANLTIDDIAHPAIAKFTFTAQDNLAYQIEPYTGNNPTLYAISGTTIAMKINAGVTHPLMIQDPSSVNYSTGLYHVDEDGTVSEDNVAQSKTSGTLYWRIPHNISGNYQYVCQAHPVDMRGTIVIKDITTL